MIARDSHYATDYPLWIARTRADAHWTDMVPKQGHADYCAAYGHHTSGLIVDGVCMRCGDVLDAAPAPAAAATAAAIADECDTYVSPAAIAAADAAPCSHWECALMGAMCVEDATRPAMTPPRARRVYRARRIAVRFFEYVHADGSPCIGEDGCDIDDAFNVNMTPSAVDDDAHTFDSVADLVDAIRRDYVRFDAYGDGMTATDPDGSQIIDYATGERECVSWHCDGIPAALLDRVIVPAVDAR